MQLNPCILAVHRFYTHVGTKVKSAEASELGFKPGEVPGGRLYDDACDSGITLNVMGTDVYTHWYEGEAQHFQGEVTAWVFHPTTETLRRWPHLQGWQVHILND